MVLRRGMPLIGSKAKPFVGFDVVLWDVVPYRTCCRGGLRPGIPLGSMGFSDSTEAAGRLPIKGQQMQTTAQQRGSVLSS